MYSLGWTGITSGTDTGNVVEAKLSNAFTAAENALNDLDAKSKHALVLTAYSTADQVPAGLGVANKIKINFGSGVVTSDVSVDSSGNITFHTAGTYNLRFISHYGRSGSTGASLLAFRMLLNGVQQGNVQVAKIDNADILQPWSDTHTIQVSSSDIAYAEVMRVSGYDNSGGLYAIDTVDWGIAPSAEIDIYKVG